MIGSKKQQENKNHDKSTDLKPELPEIDESLGELLCDECGGRGCTPYVDEQTIQTICWKCQGDGKVDWVSHITGKPQRPMFGFSSSSSMSSMGTYSTSGGPYNIHDDAIDAMAQALAKKIDEEILESIRDSPNKHMKFYNQEVRQVDNGIVSKFMFHTDT